MKTLKISQFPALAVLSAGLLPVLTLLTVAQTVDTSTGQVNDSSSSRSVAPPSQPVPLHLVARMTSAGTSSKAKGEVRFSLVGDMVNVTGEIEGLEPNSRYQLAVPPFPTDKKPEAGESAAEPERTPQNDGEQREDKDPETGAPAAGAPAAGTPEAGTPTADKPDAGKPDGTFRPGAPGAGEGTSVTDSPIPPPGGAKPGVTAEAGKLSGLLGILTADSTGGAPIMLTVRSLALTTGPGGIQGRTVTLTTVPVEGAGATPVMVASGVLEALSKEGN